MPIAWQLIGRVFSTAICPNGQAVRGFYRVSVGYHGVLVVQKLTIFALGQRLATLAAAR
jgi:hypothetical protein